MSMLQSYPAVEEMRPASSSSSRCGSLQAKEKDCCYSSPDHAPSRTVIKGYVPKVADSTALPHVRPPSLSLFSFFCPIRSFVRSWLLFLSELK